MIRRRRPADDALQGQEFAGLVPAEQAPPAAPPLSAREQRRAQLLEDPEDALRIAPPRGWPGPLAGRAASVPRPEVFRADTHAASGLYPWLFGASLPPVGAYIGWSTLTRQAFSAHPSVWVEEGLVTNPNLMLTGIPGSGKSATIKALCFRLMAFGHPVLIAGDVKGEYSALARHLGVEPVRLGPGLPGRLNPLDAGPLGAAMETTRDEEVAKAQRAEVHRRRLTLLQALLELHLKRPVTPIEQEALDVALREVTGELRGQTHLATPTLPQVHAVLKDPTSRMAHELRVRDAEIQLAREQMASLRSALGRMITGHLSGLFDQQTSISLDWSAPIQTIDISALSAYGDEVIAMVLTCISSWAQAAIDRAGGRPWIVVRDELWRQLRSGGAAMARKIDSDLRLSRAEGVIDILATHRLSDLEAVGAAGSEASGIARDLISSCETRIQLHQDTRPLALTKDAIGLTDAECALISGWSGQRGRALWKVGNGSSHAVQLVLSPIEQRLFETDERMAL